MKFPKLHLACSDDELRPSLSCVCVNKDYTYASDAHVIARHKTSEIFKDEFIESLPVNPILIPRKAIELICKKATVKVSLTEDKKHIQLHQLDQSVITYRLLQDVNYPDAERVIPNPKDAKAIDKIGINTKLLLRLTDAMGCSIPIVHMVFFDKHKSIYITSPHSDYQSAMGIIMPVNIDV